MVLDISIELDDERQPYTCSDKVKGRVLVKGDKPVNASSLLIQLLCKVTTRTQGVDQSSVTRLNDRKSVSIPYCFVKRLVTQPQQLNQTRIFSFEFTLPSETRRNEIEPAWRESPVFEHLADHALPPSWSGDKQGRCDIVHMLEVLLHRSDGYEEKLFGKTRQINFSPCRAVQSPDARCLKLVKTVNAKIAVSSRKKSIINLLTPDERHSVPFQLEVLHPTVLYAGGPVPLSVSAYPTQTTNRQSGFARSLGQLTPPESPTVSPVDHSCVPFVEGVYVYLVAYTDRRVREDRCASANVESADTQEHILGLSEMIPVCSINDRPVAVSQRQGWLTSLQSQYPELKLSAEVTPSFRSFSMRRRYELKAKVRVVLGGDYEHTVDLSFPVLVLPRVHLNVAGALRDNGELMPGLRRRISEETLPPYETVDPIVAARVLEGQEEPPPLVW